MTSVRDTILGWIEEDRKNLVGFLAEFVRIPSPNTPGDTRAAAAFLYERLQAHGVPVAYRTAKPEWPNVVGSFTAADKGPHLVLNGHIDVFLWDRQRPGRAIPGVALSRTVKSTAAASSI